MKYTRYLLIILLLLGCLFGCAVDTPADIAATTLPVYTFTVRLCEGTDLTVERLITENVSCLHDYTLQVSQMRALQGAKVVVVSGAGLEDFLDDALRHVPNRIDCSEGITLHEGSHHDHEHNHDGHIYEDDPHIWLSPANAIIMAENIANHLSEIFPQHSTAFASNLRKLVDDLKALQTYGEKALSSLSCRELITFHDGFAYLAESFGLTILKAVEEESGSEASAAQLIDLCNLVNDHDIPAVFLEANGSTSAAAIVSTETGAALYTLDMVMSGDDYFAAMYRNIDTLREALQ